MNVDVSLDVRDTDYKEYAYLMEIIDFPDWLAVEGEMSSSGELQSSYQHEFTLTGTPLTSQDAEKITMLATVTIAGDEPALDAYASKEVSVTVNAVDGD
ncbi:MAG: hypothetical protein IJU26_07070 [Synergistaceae bacterium]|nr:hypothetical protein [Synergistaceae bacterium]